MRSFVDTLLRTDTAPVLTVTAGLDRTRPNSGEDRIRVRNLLAEARTQVAALPDPVTGAAAQPAQVIPPADPVVAGFRLQVLAHEVEELLFGQWVIHCGCLPVRR